MGAFRRAGARWGGFVSRHILDIGLFLSAIFGIILAFYWDILKLANVWSMPLVVAFYEIGLAGIFFILVFIAFWTDEILWERKRKELPAPIPKSDDVVIVRRLVATIAIIFSFISCGLIYGQIMRGGRYAPRQRHDEQCRDCDLPSYG